jgi:hypothetical protein
MSTNTKSATALTRDAKAAVQMVFEELGGVPRLVEWANQPANLGTFYKDIWSKIIPKDVKAEIDGHLAIEVVRFGQTTAMEIEQAKTIEVQASSAVPEALVDGESSSS